jgi:hypothetical protein
VVSSYVFALELVAFSWQIAGIMIASSCFFTQELVVFR